MSVPAPNCTDGSALRSGVNSGADTLPARPSSGGVGRSAKLPAAALYRCSIVRIAEHDLDGILADYSSDAVLFVPSGPLKRLDAINPLFEALVSEFQKRASSFRMRQRSVDGDHAYILQDHRNRGQLVRIRYRHVCCKERKNSSPSVCCQDQAEALIVALRVGGGTGAC